MAWITPIVTWTPSPVDNADFNRIEGNIKYLREEDKTINGTTTLTDLLTISSSGITSSSSSIDLLKYSEMQAGTRVLGFTTPATGAGFETGYSGGTTLMYSLDRGAGIYKPMKINAGTLILNPESYMGKVLIGTNTDNGTDLLQVGADSDISVSMGRGKMGYASSLSNRFFISYYDNHNINDFGIQLTSSNTLLNAKASGSVIIKNNNVDLATFGADSIELKKDTTIDTHSLIINKSDGIASGVYGMDFVRSGVSRGRVQMDYNGSTLDLQADGVVNIKALGETTGIQVGSAINLYKDTTITGSLSVSEGISTDGNMVADGTMGCEGYESRNAVDGASLSSTDILTAISGLTQYVLLDVRGSIYTTSSGSVVLCQCLYNGTKLSLFGAKTSDGTPITIEIESTTTGTFNANFRI